MKKIFIVIEDWENGELPFIYLAKSEIKALNLIKKINKEYNLKLKSISNAVVTTKCGSVTYYIQARKIEK